VNALDIGWRMVLCGIGFGLFQTPNQRAMVAAAPRPRSGAAGGMLASARLLGQTAGAVITAAVFHLAGVQASGLALEIGAAVAMAGAAMSLTRIRVHAPAAAPAR
jgi:DHA2 family multidrug resistance protein-like MFS transporter